MNPESEEEEEQEHSTYDHVLLMMAPTSAAALGPMEARFGHCHCCRVLFESRDTLFQGRSRDQAVTSTGSACLHSITRFTCIQTSFSSQPPAPSPDSTADPQSAHLPSSLPPSLFTSKKESPFSNATALGQRCGGSIPRPSLSNVLFSAPTADSAPLPPSRFPRSRNVGKWQGAQDRVFRGFLP
ncbi:hypothetical protein MPTK1_3g23640 [Marchantia polymorpha subsp. ruderalis]|uniref:Uncharacterized protein n=2 Tax=Marchantia polymorpha TaxID=3197 RepID=A0AAF6B419_MARPO|nr:hypothetical protein MARPO_0024s0140 [Marchantia polymorpha]BBN06753.1 hypothetical protein Mp_3g23640 [Marchantia polymorpha subsp. ruderalis]|eukprot:PTQ43652.1 hypothetical protein MARPO_0024s0140 [Marchantia polymorpha]